MGVAFGVSCMYRRGNGVIMKKIIRPILAVGLCLCTVLVFGACSSSPKGGVSQLTLSAEEQIVANAGTDIFQKYQLEKDSSYDVTFTAYRNGLEQQKTIVSKITATEENANLLLSAVNTDGMNYSWSLTTPQTEKGKRERFDVTTMSEDGVTVQISGVGENGFTMEPNTSYLLYYVAYKKSNTSTSISEEPFKQWSTFTDKDALLKDFDCVYLVTISLTPESTTETASK